MRASLLTPIYFVMCMSCAQAGIYTCKDQDGNTVYLDTPSSEICPDAEEVKVDELPDLIEVKPLAVPSTTAKPKASKPDAKSAYKSLAITTPGNLENIRSNEGRIPIGFRVTPALNARNGHQYVLTLDGKEVYKGSQGSAILENVDRGTHVVSATVVARNGQSLISSAPVEFTLHRFTSLQGNSSPNSGS